MQNTELSHLYKSFKSIFPTAHIVIIDHTGSVIMACETAALFPKRNNTAVLKKSLRFMPQRAVLFINYPSPFRCQISCSSIYPPRILKMF